MSINVNVAATMILSNKAAVIEITENVENEMSTVISNVYCEELKRRNSKLQRELPPYSSMIDVFLEDEPPKYEDVTGNKLHLELVNI